MRYLAKVTIEPAITHGIADQVGSLQAGRLADIVLWEPAYFGVKPALVLKSGTAAWSPRSGRATPPSRAPSRRAIDRTGAATGRAAASLSATFVSAAVTGSAELRQTRP